MRKLIPLKSLYAFVAVAETGTMTRAAEALSVSHSAVSQAIKSLESQLGRPLFVRSGKRVQLTANGKKYYQQVAPALEQIVDATEALIQQPSSNRVTINMINALAVHWWVPKVEEFQHYAPNIDVRLSNLTESYNLEEEGVDIAIIHGKPDQWLDYYCEKLADDQLVLVCSPELYQQAEDKSAEAMIRQHSAIYAENARRKLDWQTWCEQLGYPVPQQRKNLTFSSSVYAVQAATRHLGVLVTHRLFVRDDIKHGLLVEVGEAVKNPHQDFYFACTPGKLKQESVLTIRAWLRQQFSEF